MSAKGRVYDEVYCERRPSYEISRGFVASLYKRFKRYEVNRYQACLASLPKRKKRLLDVGCGDGDFIFMAEGNFEECYGIDVSSSRIKRAERRARERQDDGQFQFYKRDADQGLPFQDCFFDVITCIAVLEHVLNPPDVVKEIGRVLKPRGVFIVQVPNVAWLPSRMALLFGRLPITGGVRCGADWEHLHNFTKSVLCQLLIAKGFEIERVSCSGIFPRIRRLWLSALAGDIVVTARKN